MSLQSGSNIVTKNLVFGYDTQGRFYKGEPTENLCTKYGTNLVGYGYSDCTYGSDDIGTYFIKNDNTEFYGGLILQPTNVLPGKAYTMSFEIMCDINFTCYWDANDYASNYSGNDACREATLDYSPTYTTPNKWQKVYLINKIFSDAVSPQASSSFCPQDTRVFGHKIYYRNLQVEIKEHPTKYTSTSRLNNNSLIDLAGNTSIDLSNMSFDSTAHPVYNGTSNSIIVSGIKQLTNHYTVSAWVYITAHSSDANVGQTIIQQYDNNYGWIFSLRGSNGSYLQIRNHYNGTSVAYNLYYNVSLNLNTWYFVNATDDGKTVKLYVNGKVVASTSSSIASPYTGNVYIGSFYNTSGMFFNGKIPLIHVNNVALSEKEILQNYNALKSRF